MPWDEGSREQMKACHWRCMPWKDHSKPSVFPGRGYLGASVEISGLKKGTSGDKPVVAVPAVQEAQGRPSVLVGEEPIN